MKFYIVQDFATGETTGCELSLKAARSLAESHGFARGEYEIEVVDCPVNTETVRLLLAERGGYAHSVTFRG